MPSKDSSSQFAHSYEPPAHTAQDEAYVAVHEYADDAPASPSECTTVPLAEATTLHWISDLISEQPAPTFYPDPSGDNSSQISRYLSEHPSRSETEFLFCLYFEVVHEVFPPLVKDYCSQLFLWFWSVDGWKRVHAEENIHLYPALAIVHTVLATAARHTGLSEKEGWFFNLALWELSQGRENHGLEQFIGDSLFVLSLMKACLTIY